MNKKTKNAEQARLELLEELCVRADEITSVYHLAKKHGVSRHFITVLLNEGVISKTFPKREAPYEYNHKVWGDPTMERARDLFAKERAMRPRGNKTTYIPPPDTNGKIGLTATIAATKLGLKYHIADSKMESFVKDVLEIIKNLKS